MTPRSHAILRISLALSAAALGVVLRAYQPGIAELSLWGAGAAFDLVSVFVLWLAAALLARVGRPAMSTAFLHVALLFALGLVFAHTSFFWAAIERRLTAFDVTPTGVYEFFTHTLPGEGRAAALWLVAGFHLSVLLLFLGLRRSERAFEVAAWALRGAALLALCVVLASGRVTSPLYDTFDEARLVVRAPKLTPRTPADAALAAALDRSAALPSQPLLFDKIVVLVMETMTEQKLAEELPGVAQTSFFHAERARTHVYTRYFANNQDSRTGMLDLLHARLVPYEAYSDSGLAGYEKLARLPSLLTPLHGLGYRTAFAVSQRALEEVVTDLPWDERLSLDEGELAAAAKRGMLCLTPDIYEQSCEDLALLPEVVSFLERTDRAFVFQEFIWGHAHEYNDASGKSNAQYYSAYVDALLSALRARNLHERTLVVVTSDHGFRDKSLQTERWVYAIPMWFHAARFGAQVDDRLFSHVDFRRLLFGEASGQRVADASPLVAIVGPTGSSIVSAFTPQGEMIVTRRVGPFALSLAHALPEGARPLGPDALLGIFEAYKARFDAVR